MGLFDFFRSKNTEVKNVEELIKRSSVKLCNAIFKSSMKLTEETKTECSVIWKSKGISSFDEKIIWFSILSEFIYCHLNITDRIAFSVLGNERRSVLMNELILTLQYSIFESVFKDWNEKLKDNFKKHFLDGYNESQIRYSKGKNMLDEKEPFTGNGTLSILGREIAEINNSSMNPEIILRTIEMTASSFSGLNLIDYIEDIKNGK